MNGQLEAILEIMLSNENYVTYETLAARLNVKQQDCNASSEKCGRTFE